MQFKEEELTKHILPYKILLWKHIKNLKASSVESIEGAQETYRKIGLGMLSTCLSDDGVGLAGPQVGIMKKVILVREFQKNESGEYDFLPTFRLYLNPECRGNSEAGKNTAKEWCLSVPDQGFPIERFNEIHISWQEFEDNRLVQKSATIDGLPARILQHEIDHLYGLSIPQRWKMQTSKPKSKKNKKKK